MIPDAALEGKYEILGKLGEGGMGAVYKVRHRLLDEVRVVKVIRPHLSESRELQDRFLREARLAIQLRHPNIARLHDFSIDESGTAFIVMEYVDGLNLAEVLERSGPPPLGLTLEIARGALAALGHLHRKGFVHRDISPDNLMLAQDEDGSPHVTLLDLGIAKVLTGGSGLTSVGGFLGKPRYASPEQFGSEGQQGLDARSDLYSFGIVLYQLATGVCPVQGRDLSSWIAGHLFRPPLDFAESDPEGRIPPDLRALLLRAIAKKPEERFAGAAEFSQRLEEVQRRYPLGPGDLDAALRAPGEKAPLPATIPIPGTTQGELDRQFAPVATPPPRPAERSGTLVLSPQPEPLSPLSHPLPPTGRGGEQAQKSHPERSEGSGWWRPLSRPAAWAALLALLLLAPVGIWWALRSPEGAETPAPPLRTATPAPVSPALPAAPTPEPSPAAVAETLEATPLEAPEVFPTPEPVAPPPAPAPPRPAPRTEAAEPALPKVEPAAERPAAKAPVKAAASPEPAQPADRPARLVSLPQPVYPEIARGTGLRVNLVVSVQIDERGEVVKARVRRANATTGPSGVKPSLAQAQAFEQAALAAAYKARFEPQIEDGRPAGTSMELVYDVSP